jgi:hypothetical protein
LELFVAERALRDVEATHRMHLADYQMAIAELEALVGADLHVFPPNKETVHHKAK